MFKYIALGSFMLVVAACSHGHKKDSCDSCAMPATKAEAATRPESAKVQLLPLARAKAKGEVTLKMEGSDLKVAYDIKGLKANQKHGFHIHEFGDCSTVDGTSAGSHYNPANAPHAGPESSDRHRGDLGNLAADANGKAMGELRLSGVHLQELIGRSFVIHAKEDDLKTQPAGESGERIACGVIGVTRL
jgi:superoxide dismutase, Cu-Zn family